MRRKIISITVATEKHLEKEGSVELYVENLDEWAYNTIFTGTLTEKILKTQRKTIISENVITENP